MLDQITPVVLTYNEAPNIARVLDKLQWANSILIVDSFSDDDTLAIASEFPNVKITQREFDNHASQWNYAIHNEEVKTAWVLALDADYVLSDELLDEIKNLKPEDSIQGYRANFIYCIFGKPLRGTLYPPVTILFHGKNASYVQDGHTQRISLNGDVKEFRAKILHDDQKPLARWINSQIKYMKLEATKFEKTSVGNMGWSDRLRATRILATPVMFFYCLFIKAALLDGKAGIFYTMQRTFAELMLSLFLLEQDLNKVFGRGKK